MSDAELAAFCHAVADVLGSDLSRGGYRLTASQTTEEEARCDYAGPHRALRLYFADPDGEVGCLVHVEDRWEPILSYLSFGDGMTDEEWADATEPDGPGIEDKLRFYQPFIHQIG